MFRNIIRHTNTQKRITANNAGTSHLFHSLPITVTNLLFLFHLFLFPSAFFCLAAFLKTPGESNTQHTFVVPFVNKRLHTGRLNIYFLIIGVEYILGKQGNGASVTEHLLLDADIHFQRRMYCGLSVGHSSIIICRKFGRPYGSESKLVHAAEYRGKHTVFHFLPLLRPTIIIINTDSGQIHLPKETGERLAACTRIPVCT